MPPGDSKFFRCLQTQQPSDKARHVQPLGVKESRTSKRDPARLPVLPLGLAMSGVAAALDLQGHRGAGGLAGEDTIAGLARTPDVAVTA
jgi:hypothetical protein